MTEFIGINLALGYLGLPRVWGILVAAAVIIGAASTGSLLGVLGAGGVVLARRGRGGMAQGMADAAAGPTRVMRTDWRMPSLAELPRPRLTLPRRVWMGVLPAYLVMLVLLVAWNAMQDATGG